MRNDSESDRQQQNPEMMEFDDFESDVEYEIIKINPNAIYESDDSDSSMDDEPTKETSYSPIKKSPFNNVIEDEPQPDSGQQDLLKPVKVELPIVNEVSCDSMTMTSNENSMDTIYEPLNCQKKVKRKLNLQEYKMRRANEPIFDLPKKVPGFELCMIIPATLPPIPLPTDPRPINGDKINRKQDVDYKNMQPDYEEIILVSVACNTEVSIPPEEDEDDGEKKNGSKFLKNIVNNLDRDNAETLLNSSTSLFSSIQAVIQEKRNGDNAATVSDQDAGVEHGEDKVIMHLRKDRIRSQKTCASVQTDTVSLFPPLLLSPSLIFNRIKNSRTYHHSRSRSRSSSPQNVDYDKYSNKYTQRYSRSQHSTHSSSMSSSDSGNSGTDSDSSSSSQYSSYSRTSGSSKRSGSKYRQTYGFYRQNQRSQSYAIEDQRKIVYVGGIDETTTKDEIRRKFIVYGTIKKISFHTKEDGLRYGFVTFESAQNAYEAIDNYTKDPQISKYDIRFGGRRKFCRQSYADLDSFPESDLMGNNNNNNNDMSFEALLALALAKKKIAAAK